MNVPYEMFLSIVQDNLNQMFSNYDFILRPVSIIPEK